MDWADDHHDVVVIDGEARQVAARRVKHTPAGLQELTEFLSSITGPERKAELACIIETSYGLLIAALLAVGSPVYPVNPQTVDRQRGAAGAKTDQLDAYLLAKHGRSEFADLRRLEPDRPLVAALSALTRDQESLIQMQTRLVNQLTACLKASYPVALEVFTKRQQRSTLHFLRSYPTPHAARQATAEQIAAVLKQAGYPPPEKQAAKLVATLHQPALQADEVTIRTNSRLRLSLVRHLLPVIEEIASYDQEITRLFLKHADSQIFRRVPRAGKRLAPRRFSELGEDRHRSQNAARLQALAGTSPVPYESGKWARAPSAQCLHQALAPCVAAVCSGLGPRRKRGRWTPTSASVRKRKRHSVAVRALANIWCRMILVLWTNRECYQASIFEAAQRRHAQRAA